MATNPSIENDRLQELKQERRQAKRTSSAEQGKGPAKEKIGSPLNLPASQPAGQNQGQTQATRGNSAGEQRRPGEIRRILKQARELAKKQKQEKSKGKASEVKDLASNLLTAQLLKLSWLNLIDSFGLTLIYINYHFLRAHMLKSPGYCKFGDEWMKGAPGIKGKAASFALGPVEILALFLLDAIVVMIFMIFLMFLVLIVEYYKKFNKYLPWDFILQNIDYLITKFL